MTAAFFLLLASMALLGVAICVLARPDESLWGGDAGRERNVQALMRRREELRAELERGLIERDQADKARAEIELDIKAARARRETGDGGGQAGMAKAAKGAIALFIPIFAGALYLEVGSPQAAFSTAERRVAREGAPQIDLNEAVIRLKARIRSDPGDERALGLLYRTLMTLERYGEARDVVRGAREKLGESADLLIMEADSLALSKGGVVSGEPLGLIERALELDPNHVEALWLSGIAAEETGNFAGAASFFARAGQRESDPQKQANLRELEDRARQRAGLETASAETSPDSSPQNQPGAGTLRLHIALAPELKDGVDPGQALFVFAREPGGPPAPIAVTRLSAGALPASVTLDDSSSMLPNRLLSGFAEVAVVARISASGNARATSGDLYGEIGSAAVGGDSVLTLTIDRRIP